ncbi:MAG: hypothetical protein Q4G70_16180 [Pseudomonadota bacterium]|nr:hypothetical protein [Pseudomonadota bacterium]
MSDASPVIVENSWYDGPRTGTTLINGVPHRFESSFNDIHAGQDDWFTVWPISKQEADLEVQQ